MEKKIDIKGLNKKQIIVICVVAVLIIALASIGTISAVKKENPFNVIQSAFRSTEKDIIGKWQGEGDLNGYEFFEDGTYDSYISSFSYKGNYEIKGSKLILKNPNASGSVVYRASIVGDQMKLTLASENGKAPDEKETHEFRRVKHFNFKTFTDFIQDYANDLNDDDENSNSDSKDKDATKENKD